MTSIWESDYDISEYQCRTELDHLDGKRMFAAYERLQELQARESWKAAVEQTVYDVSLSYFNIVSPQLQLDAW